MKRFTIFLICVLVLPLHAEPPKKKRPETYSRLWTRSPFTIKKPIEKEKVVDELEDWQLTGVSPYGESYLVKMMNKKDRNQRIRVGPNQLSGKDFEIVSVNMGLSINDTVVRLKTKSGQIGELRFDTKALALKAAPRAKPTTNRNQQNRTTANRKTQATTNSGAPPIPGLSNSSSSQTKRKRPRVVRPKPRK